MATLERAIEIAVEAHEGQTDKAEKPYVLHPLKLVYEMDTPEERKAAVLHDVVEDSDWTLGELREEGFSDDVVEAVEHLTKGDDESYDEFVERAKENEIARKVKRADIEHNMDLTRLDELGEDDVDRLKKYHRSWKKLR